MTRGLPWLGRLQRGYRHGARQPLPVSDLSRRPVLPTRQARWVTVPDHAMYERVCQEPGAVSGRWDPRNGYGLVEFDTVDAARRAANAVTPASVVIR